MRDSIFYPWDEAHFFAPDRFVRSSIAINGLASVIARNHNELRLYFCIIIWILLLTLNWYFRILWPLKRSFYSKFQFVVILNHNHGPKMFVSIFKVYLTIIPKFNISDPSKALN